MKTPSTFAPALTFWPGSVVLTELNDSGTMNGGDPRLYTDIVGQTFLTTGGYINSYGANTPTVFAQQCSSLSTWSSIWMSCPAGDSVSSNFPAVGALLLQSGPVANEGFGGYKGRLNFLTPSNTSAATHLITLGDSNSAKTLATPGHRPTNDANDTWIGLDNTNASASGFQLAFGAPVSISSYIGAVGNPLTDTPLERLTSTTKTFGKTIQIVSNLPTSSGPPLSVVSTAPVTNLTTIPTTYNHAGTQQVNAHIVVDTVQLSSGAATVTLTIPAAFTSASTFVCAAADNTNPDAVQVSNSSGSMIAFKGNAADVIGYTCVGY